MASYIGGKNSFKKKFRIGGAQNKISFFFPNTVLKVLELTPEPTNVFFSQKN